MNSVYNGTIKKVSKFQNISISFAPDDSGNSLGAALETSVKNGIKLDRKNFSSYLIQGSCYALVKTKKTG